MLQLMAPGMPPAWAGPPHGELQAAQVALLERLEQVEPHQRDPHQACIVHTRQQREGGIASAMDCCRQALDLAQRQDRPFWEAIACLDLQLLAATLCAAHGGLPLSLQNLQTMGDRVRRGNWPRVQQAGSRAGGRHGDAAHRPPAPPALCPAGRGGSQAVQRAAAPPGLGGAADPGGQGNGAAGAAGGARQDRPAGVWTALCCCLLLMLLLCRCW